MKIYKFTKLLAIPLLAVSCQKAADTSSTSSTDLSSLSSIACQSGSSGVALEDAKILGADNIVANQKVNFSLDSSVNCAQAQKAQWSISNMIIGQGTQIETTLNGSGVYYINVNSNAASSGAQPQRLSSSKVLTSVTSARTLRVAVTNSEVLLLGPSVGVEFNSNEFSLVVPNGTTLQNARWNFGSGSIVNSLGPVSRSFNVGTHTISVEILNSNNDTKTLQHTITILPLGSGIDCTAEELSTLGIAGPTQVPANRSFNYSVIQPDCIKPLITKVSWNFGDSTAVSNTSEVSHTYLNLGSFNISVAVWIGSSTTPALTLFRNISVIDVMETMPGPTPDPATDPNSCLNAGSTRNVDGNVISRDVACGVNGLRSDSLREQIVQVCQLSSGQLKWTEQSRSEVLLSEGLCQNQSCEVDTDSGKQVISNGASITLHTTSTPTNSCASVQEVRSCQNGVISGSSSAIVTACHNGCGEFGAHGSVQSAVISGEQSNPVTCNFGETGIIDIINQSSDKTCNDGQVVTSNTRAGDVKVKGLCPVYNWVSTETFTQCSADCGGTQSRNYECRDDKGVLTTANRCSTDAPVEQKLCDGNPEAVRESTSTIINEEAHSSGVCPKDQIGVIIRGRIVTRVTTVACIDHKVQQVSVNVIPSPWVTTPYCRDLVAKRCSQDSLSNTEAAGRYNWMKKCEDQVPAIKEFLTNFDDVAYKGISLNDSTRHLYPTFLNSSTNKPWIAPKVATGSCTVPSTAYVAAVCVSSCATPEQEIIAQVLADRKLERVSFVDALTKKLASVGTLQSNSSIRSTELAHTPVDQWVTELLDTTQPILTFNMKSGGQLKVTLNHPLLAQNGSMKLASEFKVNESLVRLGGRKDQITSIERADYYGKVYNVFVKSNDLKKNVVVISGYLSGTAFYQNEGTQYMNRDLFRQTLIRGALK